jgi:hypothetical protein
MHPISYYRWAMARPLHVSELLKSIDLAWWPEFLMNQAHPPKDDEGYRSSVISRTRSLQMESGE